MKKALKISIIIIFLLLLISLGLTLTVKKLFSPIINTEQNQDYSDISSESEITTEANKSTVTYETTSEIDNSVSTETTTVVSTTSASETTTDYMSELEFDCCREDYKDWDMGYLAYTSAGEHYVCAKYVFENEELYNKYGDFKLYYSHGTHDQHVGLFGISDGTGWHHFVMDNGVHLTVYIEQTPLSPWIATGYEIVNDCHCCDC